ncbi:MAG: hypothetical protein ABSF92_10410 [Candidatus Acidiferrales bacterium]|jgi:hypothetical protein
MATTFQKRQKEMKRLEKQRMKAERRAMKKLANRAAKDAPSQDSPEGVISGVDLEPGPEAAPDAGVEPRS